MTRASAATVGLVVAAYDQAQFLDEALRSVEQQTVRFDRIVVVDDGSHDDPASVAAAFPGVEVVRQDNAGLAAARNRGLEHCATDFVIFLDADDRLLPRAVEFGLRCHEQNPGCALVYGAHRRTDRDLTPIGTALYSACGTSAYQTLLLRNMIGSCGTVMFDRRKLAASGGFDVGLQRCEDYDVYLRLARQHSVASHPGVVADYRMHGENMSGDPAEMLRWALLVHARHRPASFDRDALAAHSRGRRRWKFIYANAAWQDRGRAGGKWRLAMMTPLASLAAAGAAALRRMLPAGIYRGLAHRLSPMKTRLGATDMGDFNRAEPVSRAFGFDRGTPVDRWYIERFLDRCRGDIRGRVLEVADDAYCRQFGSSISQQDILHVDPDFPGATVVGNLAQPGVLPEEAFDCLVLTQTLHLIYDMPAAVKQIRQSLTPGGVALLTVPGVSSVDRGEWGDSWFWSLTGHSAKRLFGDEFGPENVEVAVHGNVYAATCFLQGLAVEEIDAGLLLQDDPAYPMVICIRARRAA